MQENPVEAWCIKDKKLLDLLVQIDEHKLSEEASGRDAFYRVSDLYNLPKFPEDVKQDEEYDDEDYEPRSVFEEVALSRFLYPDDEHRGIVMLALYNIFHKSLIPYDEVAANYYGSYDNIPESYFIYFFGKDVDAYLKFDIGDESWVEAGATFMIKLFRMD